MSISAAICFGICWVCGLTALCRSIDEHPMGVDAVRGTFFLILTSAFGMAIGLALL